MSNRFENGDHVLLFSENERYLIRIDGEIVKLRGRRGAVSTARIIGKEHGTVLELGSRSFALLRPDIRDVQENLDRGPQIIIPKDSSVIVANTGLSSGMNIVEGGAGSGALTTVLLNAVCPGGSVVTYDIKQEHIDQARRNVDRTPWAGSWHPRIGDVSDGFSEKDLDAVILDVPSPELAVEGVSAALRPGGRFCSYIPTMNQMERVFGALEESGFSSVEALEMIQRPYSVKKGAVRPVHEILAHTGFLVFARWPGSF
ncbi:MAG: tRNA (adenine-N1)-methyltransferase [Candidatus Thermoplasmatota archaeon]|nr:tRNA (adenine-N1)-methyltransferase [Candidatus Thermoplasmatota archaeon]